jgi:hypothetical protein
VTVSLKSYLPDRWTRLFALGTFVFMYGSAAMQYSRWNHRYNATVHPVFHIWAILLGIVLTWISVRKGKQTK